MNSKALHHDAVVADTHNDLILLVDHFDRRNQREHFADFWLTELRAGGVDVQVLPVFLEERFQTEGALRRTLLLIERIHELAIEHEDDVAVCLNGSDIAAANTAGKIALVIALEGAHALGQDPHLIRTMERVGVRVVSLAHFGRTHLADGSGLDDTSRGGLTPHGIETLQEMDRLGIVFDLSHLGVAGVEQALQVATRPMLATHSACWSIVDFHRNLTDDQLKQIASAGGVVCIAAAIPTFIDAERPTAGRVVDHIEHVIDVAGIDHVGLGPDFIDDYFREVYGAWTPIPGSNDTIQRAAEIGRPSDLPKLTEVMVKRGFAEAAIRKVLGRNVLRVLDSVMGVTA
jgi:membrane dipeptidase